MKRSTKITSIVFPSIVVFLIFFLGIETLVLEIWQFPFTLIKMACFLFCFCFYSLMCISYYKVVFTSPGTTPNGWLPNLPEIQLEYAKERYRISQMKQQKLIDMLYPAQYCGECQEYRPPRSYHCKTCDKCILKRDHHCPWIGQCVGFKNHKYFIQFLWYTPFILILGFLWHCYGLYNSYSLLQQNHQTLEFFDDYRNVLRLGFGILEFTLAISIGGLGIVHTYQVLINTTGQESIELSQLRKNGSTKETRSLYSHSMKQNFIEIMGPKWYDWFLPTSPIGDGIHFTKRIDITV
ncbi:hypothetical protein ENUP19_0055G0047 [Entamoeba nuttalli]|uniref:Palmitoyltransferase n=2 Tax=Entamoeba nuttalli TaxID=412467 RepID=K2HSN0_ENTNP|nr:DHHC zinc finger domain containing protein [Entamoeba nuttalli P19]EKE39095.1 DHHC zinc finger domain containing protein [Entamoeba nuttalli P19]|eukprot:XP_008858571.1 DHHC zinc finger domain containing protein [Entamoeba nuttalli P19]